MPSLARAGFSPAAIFVALLAVASVAPFIDQDVRYVLESDFPLEQLRAFATFFSSGSFADLPQPYINVYFDGSNFLQGLVLAGLAAFHPHLDGGALPIHSLALIAVNIVNALAHLAAVTFFFLTTRRLLPIAMAVLATTLFCFAPVIVDIGLSRIDRLMLMPLTALCYLAVIIMQKPLGAPQGILLGAMLGLLATTKITGIIFVIIPASAWMLHLWKAPHPKAQLREDFRFIAAAIISFLLIAGILMIRYWVHWYSVYDTFRESYALLSGLSEIFRVTPRLYYNIDQLSGFGLAFQVSANAAFFMVAWLGARDRNQILLWLSFNLTIFSALGWMVVKYPRGGIHLIPFYILVLFVALDIMRSRLWADRRLAALVITALPIIPLIPAVSHFVTTATIALRRPEGIRITRDAPRAWLATHLPAGSRLCVYEGSDWANPPMNGLNLDLRTGPFNFPWDRAQAMAEFRPPALPILTNHCDAILFNSYHQQNFMDLFRSLSHDDRIEEWQAFYHELERHYPVAFFDAGQPAYYVRWVKIIDVRSIPYNSQEKQQQ